MGIVGDIIGGIGKILFGKSSSSSSNSQSAISEVHNHTYHYEPDKVRAAEIEQETKLRLADKEIERIELMRDAQMELLKAKTMIQMMIDKARVEGMARMADQLVILQEKMLDVAKKRIEIIEAGSMPIIREIEKFYNEIGDRIQASSDDYNMKKLPQLLEMLGHYEKGSAQYEIYMSQINDDRARQNKFVIEQMEKISERQNLVLQSFLSSKDKIIEQTGQITQSIAEGYLKKQIDGLLPQGNMENLKQ